LVEKEIPHPRGRVKRERAARRIREVFSQPVPEMEALTQEKASEILLVARWFRLREREMGRTLRPDEWLGKYWPQAAPISSASPSAG
jgi:hypothetical protein